MVPAAMIAVCMYLDCFGWTIDENNNFKFSPSSLARLGA